MGVLDSITAFLMDSFGPIAPVAIVGGLGILLVVLALPMLATKQKDPFDRLDKRRASAKRDDQQTIALRTEGADFLEKYSDYLEPQDTEEYSDVRKKLMQAGYRSQAAVRIFYFAQMIAGLGLMAAGAALMLMTKGDGAIAPVTAVKMVMLPGALGYIAPKYWVSRRQAARNKEISQGFPDSLDMMLVCVEAGQSLDQSIVRVSKELATGFPALAEEYQLIAHEMKAGKDKTQVLRDFSDRLEHDDVSSFVTVLIQSQTYGTPISEALRVYAAEMRDKRVMRAEEKANTLPTKMTLATMLLTVPPLLIILLGPSLIEIGKAFSGG